MLPNDLSLAVRRMAKCAGMGGPFGAALAGEQRKCTHYTLLTQSSSPRSGLKHKASTKHRHRLSRSRMALSIFCRLPVDVLSMHKHGASPLAPRQWSTRYGHPFGTVGKSHGRRWTTLRVDALSAHSFTPLAHTDHMSASEQSNYHYVMFCSLQAETSLRMHDTGKSEPPSPVRARGFGWRVPGAGARSPGNAGVRR